MFDTSHAVLAVDAFLASVEAAARAGEVSEAEWVDAVARCRDLTNRVEAAQTVALAALAHTVSLPQEDGTTAPLLRWESDPRIDAGALVTNALGVSSSEAERRVDHAIRLSGPLRPLLDVMATGTLDGWRARIASRELYDAAPDAARAVAAEVADRLRGGRLRTGSAVRAATRTLLSEIDPASIRTAATKARDDRSLTRFGVGPCEDEWTLRLPSDQAVPTWAAIDTEARRLRAAGEADTLDQARADALVRLVLAQARVQTTVVYTTPATPDHVAFCDSLLPVVTGGQDVVVPSTLLRYAAGTPADRLACHPGTGAVLPTADQVRRDVTRTAYRPTAEQTAWVRLRDGHCRFPGCTAGARHCDLDHVRAWGVGSGAGATVRWNLLLLCRRHHRVKQEDGWRVRLHPDGRVHWRTPAREDLWTEPLDHLTGPPPVPLPQPPSHPPVDPSLDEPRLSRFEHDLTLRLSPDLRTREARRRTRLADDRRAERRESGAPEVRVQWLRPRRELRYAGRNHPVPPRVDTPPF